MKLLDSLLDAIVRLEGDALVMHVGEKPYVITASASMNAYRGPLAWGQVELSSRVLTFDAVSSMLTEILPVDQQRALDEFGAIEHEILPPNGILDRFTVVAARGGEDVWVEVRRKPIVTPVPDAAAATTASPASVAAPSRYTAASGSEIAAPAAAAPAAAAPPDAAQPVAAARPDEIEENVPRPASGLAAHEAPVTAEEPPPPAAAPTVETIVVALPGEVTEEVALAGVSDDAIQIIDDELQGVPTDAEVDAMLAATASALLTSGLGSDDETFAVVDMSAGIDDAHAAEAVAPDEHDIDLAGEVELTLDHDATIASDVPSTEFPIEIALNIDQEPEPASAGAAIDHADAHDVEPPPDAPPFELVAPTELPAEAVAEDVPEAAAEQTAAEGPLFSDDAIAAAAAADAIDIPAPIEAEEAVAGVEIVLAATEEEKVAGVDLGAHVAVWEHALKLWSTPVDAVVEQHAAAGPPTAAPQPAAHAEPATDVEARAPKNAAGAEPTVRHEDVSGVVESSESQEFTERLELREIEEIVDAAIAPALPAGTSPLAEMRMETNPESRFDEAALDSPGPSGMADAAGGHAEAQEGAAAGVVVPLARSPIKAEPAIAPFRPSDDAALMHTLRVAAARGAAIVYVVAQSKPMIRVDGEIVPLESEPVLTAADVERLVMELAPPRRRDALQNGPVEWLCDVPEVGRVRCLTFRDHRGPGVLFRMFPPRAISADQLALTAEVQALCQQPDGLVLVTGARASGKSTLLNAFVDLINRTRSDHVITIESQIGFVHESRKSFISQRETRGDADLAAAVARAALREDPDVLMIEELKTADLAAAAIDAAESGRLVLASLPAASTIAALERLLELFPADRRARVRGSLATALRGVIAQVLLRRVTGGRVAAREILLNTPGVSTLILEGKMFQLPVALDSGRRHGMVPLTDALAGFVRDGLVHPAEAYRKALDRAALVAALKRDGVDTSFAERLA